ncbi:hypothetical protein VTI28DRAFT_9096 [Corynascus sepedonium]
MKLAKVRNWVHQSQSAELGSAVVSFFTCYFSGPSPGRQVWCDIGVLGSTFISSQALSSWCLVLTATNYETNYLLWACERGIRRAILTVTSRYGGNRQRCERCSVCCSFCTRLFGRHQNIPEFPNHLNQ